MTRAARALPVLSNSRDQALQVKASKPEPTISSTQLLQSSPDKHSDSLTALRVEGSGFCSHGQAGLLTEIFTFAADAESSACPSAAW